MPAMMVPAWDSSQGTAKKPTNTTQTNTRVVTAIDAMATLPKTLSGLGPTVVLPRNSSGIAEPVFVLVLDGSKTPFYNDPDLSGG